MTHQADTQARSARGGADLSPIFEALTAQQADALSKHAASGLEGGVDTLRFGPFVLPSHWMQGRAAFGGLVGALGAHTARLAFTAHAAARGEAAVVEASARPLRSALVTFAGPAGGETVITTRILRVGRSAGLVGVDIYSDGALAANMSFAFGAGRPTTASQLGDGTTAPERAAMPSAPHMPPPMPQFLNNMEIKFTGEGVPASGAKDRFMSAWVRLREDTPAAPDAKLLLIADMPPPVVMSHYKVPINASSMTWALEFVESPASIPDAWFFLRYEMLAGGDGYTQQRGMIYGEDGRLLAVSQQTMTYFEPESHR